MPPGAGLRTLRYMNTPPPRPPGAVPGPGGWHTQDGQPCGPDGRALEAPAAAITETSNLRAAFDLDRLILPTLLAVVAAGFLATYLVDMGGLVGWFAEQFLAGPSAE